MQEPAPGTNIHLIWTEILTDDLLSYPQIKEKIRKFCPQINPQSFHVHLKSLTKRNFAEKEIMANGQAGFRHLNVQKQADLLGNTVTGIKKKRVYPTVPANLKILKYLKKRVGKQFIVKELNKALKLKGSGAWDVLKAFDREGYVSGEYVDKKLTYTVLPEIENCDKPPSTTHNIKKKKQAKAKREVIKATIEHVEQPVVVHEPIQEQLMPNVLDMTMGQVGAYVTNLRDENIKLKQTIETIVHLAIQAGVVEQE